MSVLYAIKNYLRTQLGIEVQCYEFPDSCVLICHVKKDHQTEERVRLEVEGDSIILVPIRSYCKLGSTGIKRKVYDLKIENSLTELIADLRLVIDRIVRSN